MNSFTEALAYPFFRNALLAGILASIACGVIGSYVVVKRISSVSGGISHAAFGGIGLGYLLGFNPMIGALGFGLLSGLLVSATYRYRQASLDSVISMVWSVGMALGIMFITMTPGYAPDLSSYLFGNILFVPQSFLVFVVIVDLIVIATVCALFHYFELVCFDEEFAEVIGLKAGVLHTILLLLISVVVVTLIRVVGAILTIALLTTPAVIARQWSDELLRMMIFSAAICCVCTSLGLFISYWLADVHQLNVPTGPLIILLATIGYIASSLFSRLVARRAIA